MAGPDAKEIFWKLSLLEWLRKHLPGSPRADSKFPTFPIIEPARRLLPG